MRLPIVLRCAFITALLCLLASTAGSVTTIGVDWNSGLPVDSAALSLERGGNIRISWPDPPLQGQGLYLLFYSPDRNFSPGRATLLGATQRSFFVDPVIINRLPNSFYRVYRFPQGLGISVDEIMIEDFEDGQVSLTSYPGQDLQPDAWEVNSAVTYDSTLFSLELYGNTWKVEAITPTPITAGTVWRASVLYSQAALCQAIGVGDGVHELFYIFKGDTVPGPQWDATYTRVAGANQWALIQLPIGNDWMTHYGSLPTINRIFYVNDKFNNSSPGISYFDEIHDITEDLPNVPQVHITAQGDSSQLQPFYQFTSTVIDPDSPNHVYLWDFGDSTFSNLANPSHTYADRGYRTVSLIVRDNDSLFGDAAIHLQPPPGTPLPHFTLDAAGDVMMGRRYAQPGGIIPTYGVNYIFERTKSMFGDAADYSMVNLETPLTNQGYPHPNKSIVFKSDPSTVSGLVFAGFDYVALGNNHTTDYMEPGLLQTIHVLDSTKIKFSGSGMDTYWATRPAYFTEHGIRVAVLSYCNRIGDDSDPWVTPLLNSGYNKAGFAMFDAPTLQATIPIADSLADLVVVQVHAGTEYDTNPLTMVNGTNRNPKLDPEDYTRLDEIDSDSTDRVLKHLAIDLGADVVLCHHPHVLQGFEVYNNKLIVHSFGNFAFEQTYWETYPSMILYCDADLNGFSNFSFKPVYIDDYVPTPATGELSEAIMRRMASYSRDLNNTEVSFDSATCTGKIATSPSQVSETSRNVTATVTFQHEGSYWVSEPLRVQDPGFLSGIMSISGIPGGSTLDLARGREILYMGGMEYEGGWLWNHNSTDIFQEPMYPHGGQYSLAVRRSAGQSVLWGDLEDHIPVYTNRRYSIDGWISGTNAKNAQIGVAFFSSRYPDSFLSEQTTTQHTGSFPWTRCYANLTMPPAYGSFANVRCRNEAPTVGTGTARFDDLNLVEWNNDWSTISTGYTALPYPTEHTFIQLRCNQAVTAATVTYRMTTRTIQ